MLDRLRQPEGRNWEKLTALALQFQAGSAISSLHGPGQGHPSLSVLLSPVKGVLGQVRVDPNRGWLWD